MVPFDPQLALERLKKLKANILIWAMHKYIDELRETWKPLTQINEVEIYHGSKKGDIVKHKLYFDERTLMWTTKEIAFQSYLMKNLKEECRW